MNKIHHTPTETKHQTEHVVDSQFNASSFLINAYVWSYAHKIAYGTVSVARAWRATTFANTVIETTLAHIFSLFICYTSARQYAVVLSLIVPDSGVTSSFEFPTIKFQFSFTLLSKFFSAFLHSTCLLSVFDWYLELAEIYLLFWTLISKNSTLYTEKFVIALHSIDERDYNPF